MGGSNSASSKPRGPTPQIFQRIAYISPILEFSAVELIDAIRLSHVCRDWRESVMDYCPELWRQIARCVVEEPGLASNFLYAFQVLEFEWAIRNVYEPSRGNLDPNVRFFGGAKSALFVALKANNVAVVELLLEKGACENFGATGEVIGGGTPPLYFATIRSSVPAVKALLAHGAKDIPVNRNGVSQSAFACAAESGNLELLAAFVDAFVAQDGTINEGASASFATTTTLFDCATLGHEAGVSALIKLGINPRAVDDSGNNILHVCKNTLVIFLVGKQQLSAELTNTNKRGDTPLMRAARQGDEAKFKALLSFSSVAERNRQNQVDGSTCLHLVAAKGSGRMLEMALDNGMSESARVYDWAGATVQHLPSQGVADACWNDIPDCGRHKIRRLPIHLATENFAKSLEILVQRGCGDVDSITCPNGMTCAQLAASTQRVDSLRAIFDTGAATIMHDELQRMSHFGAIPSMCHLTQSVVDEYARKYPDRVKSSPRRVMFPGGQAAAATYIDIFGYDSDGGYTTIAAAAAGGGGGGGGGRVSARNAQLAKRKLPPQNTTREPIPDPAPAAAAAASAALAGSAALDSLEQQAKKIASDCSVLR